MVIKKLVISQTRAYFTAATMCEALHSLPVGSVGAFFGKPYPAFPMCIPGAMSRMAVDVVGSTDNKRLRAVECSWRQADHRVLL